MRPRREAGQAVMLVLMGIMLVGGLVVWVATGDFHMMPMHGKAHSKEEDVSAAPHGHVADVESPGQPETNQSDKDVLENKNK